MRLRRQDDVAGWWTGAIGAQWGFGFPLTIAELDPADLTTPVPNDTSPTELIIATEQADMAPTVAATGSCDGLPDAPPRTGTWTGAESDTPARALADFLASPRLADPALPTGGYTEMITTDSTISYVVDVDDPLIVITVTQTEGGWTITEWSAAAC